MTGGRPRSRDGNRRATPLRVARADKRRAAFEQKYARAQGDFARFWCAVDYLRGAWRSNPAELTGPTLRQVTDLVIQAADGIYATAAKTANTKTRRKEAA